MKNLILTLVAVLSIEAMSAQIIDSVAVLDMNTPPDIEIFGLFYHTGYQISHIETTVADTVTFTLYFKECAGYLEIVPFDTIVSAQDTWPLVPEWISVIAVRDTNTVNTDCVITTNQDTLDILTFNYSTLYVSDPDLIESICLYPNPTNNNVKMSVDQNIALNNIRLFDLNGRLIRTFPVNVREFDCSGIQSGVYFLKFESEKGTISKKIRIE